MSEALVPRRPSTPEAFDAYAAEALGAIESASTPDEIEHILGVVKTVEAAARLADKSREQERRWRVIALKAEAKKGELIGPPDRSANAAAGQHGLRGAKTNVEHQADHQARQVAKVAREQPQVFDDYLANEEEPSRAGLLKTAADAKRAKTEAALAPIADAAERDLRLRRVKTLHLIAEAEAAGAFLHAQLGAVIDAAQHDGIERHVSDLRESARLLNLVADQIDNPRLRRVK